MPFKASAAKETGADGQQQINVNLDIDSAKVEYETVNGRHTGKLRITIFYADDSGNYLGVEWKMLDLNLLESTYQRFMQSGIPLSIPIPLKAQKEILKVIVYDLGSDRIGSKLIKVR